MCLGYLCVDLGNLLEQQAVRAWPLLALLNHEIRLFFLPGKVLNSSKLL